MESYSGTTSEAANLQFTKTSIIEIRTYNEPGYEGDIMLMVNGNGAVYYFFMLGADNSTTINYAHLMQAVKNNWSINLVYDPNTKWSGSSNPFCKINSIGYSPNP